MRKVKEICRLYLKKGLHVRQVARSCKVSPSTAQAYIEKLKKLNISSETIDSLSEDELYRLLFPETKKRSTDRTMPDFEYLTKEMKKKGVTLQLLHEEYKQVHPDGYAKTQFYALYRDYIKKLDPVMRFNHKAGEKMFEDFSGDKPHYVDPQTGEIIEAELFVACLGASSYIFSHCVPSQKVEDFIECNVKAFEYYGGCPKYVVIDNLKSGVKDACYYDPEINVTFAELADHYDVCVLPTRVRTPQDNAKAENAVLQAQRRIVASIRNRTFFSLHELNEAVYEETEKLNKRIMGHLEQSRYDLFIELEKPVLASLPKEQFKVRSWKKATVHIDYHVEVEKSYYSVSYTLIKEVVEIRYDTSVVYIYLRGKRVASHIRTHRKGEYITDPAHRPRDHKNYLEWTPERIQKWGAKIGPATKLLMEKIMETRNCPEYGFRGCLGIVRLSKSYTPERVDNACKRALSVGAYSYKSVQSILKRGLDNVVEFDNQQTHLPLQHSNIRGQNYYKEGIQ